jgi:hypothetical protein
MKTLTYLFALLAGFWTVLYVSPLVFMAVDILRHITQTVEGF